MRPRSSDTTRLCRRPRRHPLSQIRGGPHPPFTPAPSTPPRPVLNVLNSAGAQRTRRLAAPETAPWHPKTALEPKTTQRAPRLRDSFARTIWARVGSPRRPAQGSGEPAPRGGMLLRVEAKKRGRRRGGLTWQQDGSPAPLSAFCADPSTHGESSSSSASFAGVARQSSPGLFKGSRRQTPPRPTPFLRRRPPTWPGLLHLLL